MFFQTWFVYNYHSGCIFIDKDKKGIQDPFLKKKKKKRKKKGACTAHFGTYPIPVGFQKKAQIILSECMFENYFSFFSTNQNICCGYSKEPSQWDGFFLSA